MDNMDKILTRKILGLKIGDILKCVILVVIGYCIAVMLGNCNCVEGWCDNNSCNCADLDTDCQGPNDDGYTYPCPDSGNCLDVRERCGENTDCAPAARTILASQQGINEDDAVHEYECVQGHWCRRYTDGNPAGTCVKPPGGAVGGFGGGRGGSYGGWCVAPPPTPATPGTPVTPETPVTPTPTPPATVWTCQTTYATGDRDCYEHTVGSNHLPDNLTHWPTREKCSANCSTPPPPPPPSPPPTPKDCTYSGDKYTGPKDPPQSLNQEWWKESEGRCESCSTNITNCREEMKNYLQYVKGVESEKLSEAYNGFCLQTVGESVSGERGDCGRIKLTKDRLHVGMDCTTALGSDACIKDGEQIYIPDPAHVEGGADTCKSYRGGDLENMAWVKDSLDLPCEANCPDPDDCTTSNTFTPPTTVGDGRVMDYAETLEQELRVLPQAQVFNPK